MLNGARIIIHINLFNLFMNICFFISKGYLDSFIIDGKDLGFINGFNCFPLNILYIYIYMVCFRVTTNMGLHKRSMCYNYQCHGIALLDHQYQAFIKYFCVTLNFIFGMQYIFSSYFELNILYPWKSYLIYNYLPCAYSIFFL